MIRRVLLGLAVLAAFGSAPAYAQRGGSFATGNPYAEIPDHKIEIGGIYGYVWTTSRDFSYLAQRGSVDIKSTPFGGFFLDIQAQPGVQIELLWTHQDTELQFKSGGITEKLTDISVEYYQIGALRGLPKGKVLPFGSFSLGATRYHPKDQILGVNVGDEWRFSVILGIGAKAYLGEKIGIRVGGSMPFTIFSGGAGFYVGGGGSGITLGGSGIAQWTVQVGLFLNLGQG